PLAQAQQAANLEINTPAINAIKSELHDQFLILRPYLQNGTVGLTDDGMMAMHDASRIPLANRGRIEALIRADNETRLQLYDTLAEANGHPEWAGQIRSIFAQRWIDKAPSGWYVRKKGAWVQK
ncbi:MAG: DUF1318 domain-containing protein, partial [Pseudomonadota bacterium]|nr:DUF1318 domain-containing protein [Pseudomonadota bacterium]